MKTIKVKPAGEIIVDDDVFEWASKNKWHLDNKGYAFRNRTLEGGIRSRIIFHRAVIGATKGQNVDHINGNPLDNRRENLRLCTLRQNMQNRRKLKAKSSAYKGISWNKKYSRWIARICINGKATHIGTFKCEITAARAYDEKAKEHFKEFSNLNFAEPT